MHAVQPSPVACIIPRREHAGLLRSLAVSMAAIERQPLSLAQVLPELGAIELPPGQPTPQDRVRLQAAAPLYFASELENAGLLPTAELIAGLFASGAINQPLGPSARAINDFWRGRGDRLAAAERQAIFTRVIEPAYFDPLMTALCEAIVAQADGGALHERVALESAMDMLGNFLAQRVDAMASIAVRDIVETINLALGFLRDRMLQSAFGVRSLWNLVAIAGAGRGQAASRVQRHVDQGRAGQTVLLWLAAHAFDSAPLLDPRDFELIGAAQRWLSGRIPPAARASALSGVAAALPVAA